MESQEAINIYQYLNYREYLKDKLGSAKLKKDFTLRKFARQAGFGSHTFISQLINGTRSATIETTIKISKGFNHSIKEREFFELLVRFEHAPDLDEKNVIYKKIVKFRPADSLHLIEEEHYEIFSNWYVLAIREMVMLDAFKEDYEWIAKNVSPQISSQNAEKALKLLINLKYLIRNNSGLLIQADTNISTGREVTSISIKNYHANNMELAKKSMDSINEEWRDISSVTFAVNRNEFSYIKNRVGEFRREMLQYLSDKQKYFKEDVVGTKRTVYQLNFQLFNLSDIHWKKKKKIIKLCN